MYLHVINFIVSCIFCGLYCIWLRGQSAEVGVAVLKSRLSPAISPDTCDLPDTLSSEIANLRESSYTHPISPII